MPSSDIVKRANSEILTGRLWRKNHSLFNKLPFYSDIPRSDDIGVDLLKRLSPDEWYASSLVVSNPPFSTLNLIIFNRKLGKDWMKSILSAIPT
jgi:hypothetical protein